MNIIDIINKKQGNMVLTDEEIKYIINSYTNDEIEDYQMSSLLSAIEINGMTDEEVISLNKYMIDSGDTIDLSNIKGIVVDKHSTGGVGDKTTLILGPLVATCGLKVPKMSGRGLGHTGGTIDKLEAIKNIKVELSLENFIKQVNEIGIVIASQTGDLVPADKKIYALRDVTGTVESIPLIASSIMSKKIASGAKKLVIDLKIGSGALMNDLNSAKKLANLMIKIGKSYEVEVICVLTNMNEPLGYAVGNGLEVLESIEVLKGNGETKLTELVLTLATYMLALGKNISLKEAYDLAKTNLENKKALEKFYELIKYQNGDIDKIEMSSKVFSLKSPKTGFLTKIDAYRLGELARDLGAGRHTKEDLIDYGVGLFLNKKVGDYIIEEEEILKIYYNKKDINISEVIDCFEISTNPLPEEPLIYEIIK